MSAEINPNLISDKFIKNRPTLWAPTVTNQVFMLKKKTRILKNRQKKTGVNKKSNGEEFFFLFFS